MEVDGTLRRRYFLGARGLNCHRSLLRAKSIAIGIAPRQHRYARTRRWQFQIFAETWTKLSLSQPTEEDSCGDAHDILFRPTMRYESCGSGAAMEMDFSFRSRMLRFVFFSAGTQYLVHYLPSERHDHVLPSASPQRQPPALRRLRLGMAVARKRPTRLFRCRPLCACRPNQIGRAHV